jgi:predicted ArsR family transcriptional regulator
MLRKQFLETSRGRIAELLQRGTRTVDALATALRLTPNAVRAQLTVMERTARSGGGLLPGATRPSHTYQLTPALEELLSGAYVPLLVHLVRTFAGGLRRARLDPLLRKPAGACRRVCRRQAPSRAISTRESERRASF